MAFADFLVGIFGITGNTFMYLVENELTDWHTVKLCGSLPLFGSLIMSILSLTILSIDRSIAVVYALRYQSIMTNFRANVLVGIMWFTVIIIVVIQGGIYFGISWEMELKVRTYELTLFFTLGAIVLGIGNAKLYVIVRSKRQSLFITATKDVNCPRVVRCSGYSITKVNKNMGRVFSDSKICVWMTSVFIVCWLPTIIYHIVLTSGELGRVITPVYTICIFFATLNSLLNPVIYLIKRKDFRKRFKELFIHCKNLRITMMW